MLYLIWASFYTEFCPTTTSRAVVHSYLGEAGWALSHHPPALIESIPYAIYLGSSVPRSRILNVINKISLTGPTKVGEKEANFGLRMLSNTVACTPRVFMPKDAYAYSQFVSCLPFESSAVVIGNTRWTRSITGTAERFSLYPFRQPCHMTFHWSREGLRKCIGTARKEQNLINPRLGTRGRSKMWIYGMFEALEKESKHITLYREKDSLVWEPKTRRDKTPWMWWKESATAPEPRFYLLMIFVFCLFVSSHRVLEFFNFVPWRNLGLWNCREIEIKPVMLISFFYFHLHGKSQVIILYPI